MSIYVTYLAVPRAPACNPFLTLLHTSLLFLLSALLELAAAGHAYQPIRRTYEPNELPPAGWNPTHASTSAVLSQDVHGHQQHQSSSVSGLWTGPPLSLIERMDPASTPSSRMAEEADYCVEGQDGEDEEDGTEKAMFGQAQVLSLQDQLQQRDAEITQLKRQLQYQRGLMQQMQAALLDQNPEPGPRMKSVPRFPLANRLFRTSMLCVVQQQGGSKQASDALLLAHSITLAPPSQRV
jgi:hypothetical protein